MRYLEFFANVIYLCFFFAIVFWLMKELQVYIDKDYFIITTLVVFVFLRQSASERMIEELHEKWVKNRPKEEE